MGGRQALRWSDAAFNSGRERRRYPGRMNTVPGYHITHKIKSLLNTVRNPRFAKSTHRSVSNPRACQTHTPQCCSRLVPRRRVACRPAAWPPTQRRCQRPRAPCPHAAAAPPSPLPRRHSRRCEHESTAPGSCACSPGRGSRRHVRAVAVAAGVPWARASPQPLQRPPPPSSTPRQPDRSAPHPTHTRMRQPHRQAASSTCHCACARCARSCAGCGACGCCSCCAAACRGRCACACHGAAAPRAREA